VWWGVTDTRTVGRNYAVVACLFLLIGFLLMLLIRWQLAYPGRVLPLWLTILLGDSNAPGGIMLPEFYSQLVAMHGMVMVFLAVRVSGAPGRGDLPPPE
jgi:cytochrome c oxidase subunit 1